MKVNTKQIGQFLKTINELDYEYLQLTMQMRNGIQNLIARHNLSKAEFCKRFQITTRQYPDYIVGNYNYSLNDMACLNASFIELEAKLLEKEVPIKVAK